MQIFEIAPWNSIGSNPSTWPSSFTRRFLSNGKGPSEWDQLIFVLLFILKKKKHQQVI